MAQEQSTLDQLIAGLPKKKKEEEPSLDALLASLPKKKKEEQPGLFKRAYDFVNTGLMPSWIPRTAMAITMPNQVNEYPTLAGMGAEVTSGLTSPASLGLAALSGGTSLAARAGMTGLAKGLNTAVKVFVTHSEIHHVGRDSADVINRYAGRFESVNNGVL